MTRWGSLVRVQYLPPFYFNNLSMGNLKKKRRLKINKHKRRKRARLNRHKKRTWQG